MEPQFENAPAVVFPAVLPTGVVARSLQLAEARYRDVDAMREQGTFRLPVHDLGPGQRFVATASSFTLEAVLSETDLQVLLRQLASGPARSHVEEALGGPAVLDLTQAWVRRQYAPAHAPRFHAPHGWHQDGALGFDFAAAPVVREDPNAILKMVTCWIALTPCGRHAPGLEFVRAPLNRLLLPTELQDQHVRGRFPPEAFWRPDLAAGDALLFSGEVLHRTWVDPVMQTDRTSIELRLFAAGHIPDRLRPDRFVPFGGG